MHGRVWCYPAPNMPAPKIETPPMVFKLGDHVVVFACGTCARGGRGVDESSGSRRVGSGDDGGSGASARGGSAGSDGVARGWPRRRRMAARWWWWPHHRHRMSAMPPACLVRDASAGMARQVHEDESDRLHLDAPTCAATTAECCAMAVSRFLDFAPRAFSMHSHCMVSISGRSEWLGGQRSILADAPATPADRDVRRGQQTNRPGAAVAKAYTEPPPTSNARGRWRQRQPNKTGLPRPRPPLGGRHLH